MFPGLFREADDAVLTDHVHYAGHVGEQVDTAVPPDDLVHGLGPVALQPHIQVMSLGFTSHLEDRVDGAGCVLDVRGDYGGTF